MFLGWFDDTPKKSEATKIEEAIERYMPLQIGRAHV